MRSLIPPLDDDNNIMSQHHLLPQPDDLADIHPSYSLQATGNGVPGSLNDLQSMYYQQYSDHTLPDSMQLASYPYSPQDQPVDIQYILGPSISHSQHLFANENANLDIQEHHDTLDPSIRSQSFGPDPLLHSPHAPTIHDFPPPEFSSISPYTVLSPTPESFGHGSAISPSMVHHSVDLATDFDSGVHSLNTHTNPRNTCAADPYATAFLQEQLGDKKWNIFSARLFERRLGSSRTKSRNKPKNSDHNFSTSSGGATAVDFLVKVEVVKEVLRTYVPHPYNPLKSLTHAYGRSPRGYVTLTRSTVLVLSGWSNTQFSYWARRSEGISVLAVHDHRLRTVAMALEQRLRAENMPCPSFSLTQDVTSSPDTGTEETNVTGKGLDILIEEVKKNTGASPFLRGKHSSLDAFGSTNAENDAGAQIAGSPHANANSSAPVYMPTFQAMEYTHSPSFALPPVRKRKPRRANPGDIKTAVATQLPSRERQDMESSVSNPFSQSMPEPSTPDVESPSSLQSTSSISPTFITSSHPHRASTTGNMTAYKDIDENGVIRQTEDTSREYFPVSDSRSDHEGHTHRKRLSDFSEDDIRKRRKQYE